MRSLVVDAVGAQSAQRACELPDRVGSRRKVEGGFGGFKISGNANYLPYTDEELAQQEQEAAAKK